MQNDCLLTLSRETPYRVLLLRDSLTVAFDRRKDKKILPATSNVFEGLHNELLHDQSSMPA